VVRAFPGGSEQFSNSINRVEGFTNEFRDELGIEISNSIEELANGMDAFLLESVDGRQHLEQFKILAEYGKPIFIDKPLTCCYDEAKELFELGKARNVPVMTSSSLRYALGIADALEADEKVQACHAFGAMSILEDYRDYFWYGIHSAEILFTMMGTGCQEVHAVLGEDYDLLVGVWNDGRIGTITGKRVEPFNFGCSLLTDKGEKTTVATHDIPWYALMMGPIVEFFKTGITPIPNAESLEIIAFLEAASRSRTAGGTTIKLNEL
jgi:GFO/IDH/MocA oxidoreductase family protein